MLKILKTKPNQDSSHNSQRGFTILELLIAMPIATIVVIILFGSLFTQYTAVLAASTKSNLRSSGQVLLINIQDELLFTIAYGAVLNPDLADSDAPSGGWRHDSNPETLIINEIALDSTRRDDDRNIVRRRLNPCISSSVSANPVAINNVIYFVKDNPNSNYDTLYKRTITPTYNYCGIDTVTGNPCVPTTSTCKTNAKKTSCSTAVVGTNNCIAEDSKLSENVLDFEVEYYAKNNIPTQFPASADKVELLLTLGEKVYGREIEVEVKHTIRKIN
jgi:type II secretory pathway pseudopilin PulG